MSHGHCGASLRLPLLAFFAFDQDFSDPDQFCAIFETPEALALRSVGNSPAPLTVEYDRILTSARLLRRSCQETRLHKVRPPDPLDEGF